MVDLKSIFSNEKAKSVGDWHIIQWIPDLISGETLNIGVLFEDSFGKRYVEVLENYEKIGKFLGPGFIYQAKLTCNIVREIALTMPLGMKVSEQINFVKKGFTQGDTAAEITSLLFNKVVTLDKKLSGPINKKYTATPRDRLYNKLQDKLKINLELDFELYVPENPYTKIVNSNEHSLYLPFRSGGNVASLASASYADIQHIKCNLYDAQRDVNTAVSHVQDYKKGSIFVLMPNDKLNINKKIEIENEIDELKWHFSKIDVDLIAEQSEDLLSDKVSEWCLCA